MQQRTTYSNDQTKPNRSMPLNEVMLFANDCLVVLLMIRFWRARTVVIGMNNALVHNQPSGNISLRFDLICTFPLGFRMKNYPNCQKLCGCNHQMAIWFELIGL